MASEEIRQRADFLGTLVVTRDTGKKLGVVSQLWVDIDQQEVVALSLKPNLLYGTEQPMLLDSICQIGDVILVENEDVIEDLDVESYTSVINCEVITETGELLGKVRGYKFDVDSGKLTSIIIASVGLPLIPDQVVSTYELGIDEVVSSGPDRLIVFEGSEERLVQLSVGILERVGLGRAPWEREDEGAYASMVRTENQLPSGLKQPIQTPLQQRQPEREVVQEWDEDNWDDRREQPKRLRQEMPIETPRYDRDEPETWSEASGPDRYQAKAPYRPPANDDDYDDDDYYDEDDAGDVWADKPPASYQPQPVNIPNKVKELEPEYDE